MREIIRARGEDPAKYLKEQIMAGKAVLTEEDKTEIYARAVWEMLQKEQMANACLISPPAKEFNNEYPI